MSNTSGIKYISPSVMNLRCFGTGNISVALQNPFDEFVMNLSGENGKMAGTTYSGRKNDIEGIREKLFSFAAVYGAECCKGRSVSIDIINRIPFAAGLSKTESGIAAIAMAMTDIFNIGLGKNQVFDLICDISSGMDYNIDLSSVASAIFGGIVAFDPGTEKRIMKIYCPAGLQVSIFVSDRFRNSGSWSDLFQSDQVSANTVSMLYGLMTSDLDIFSQSIRNNTVISALANENNLLNEIMNTSNENGALGAGISSTGGSYFILYGNSLIRDNNNSAIVALLESRKVSFSLYDTSILLNGIYKA